MSCRFSCCLSLALAGLLLISSCGRPPVAPGGRFAIVTLENLSADTALDWIAPAVTRSLAFQLATVPHLQPLVAVTNREAAASQAPRVLRGFFRTEGPNLHLEADIEDTSTHRTVAHLDSVGTMSGGVVPLLDQLAKQISPAAAPCATRQNSALEAFGSAWLAATPDEAAQRLERSVIADPHFGAAWISWVEVLGAAGKRDQVQQVLDRSRQVQLAAADRARLDILAASLTGNVAQQQTAFAELAKALPNDLGALRALAQTANRAREFPQAIAALEKLTQLAPKDVAVWNGLAYAYAYSGDFDKARKSIEKTSQLEPGNPNSDDSKGEIDYLEGHFGDAERHFLAAVKANQQFLQGAPLYKAAMARFLTGDLAGADGLFGQYLEVRKQAGDQLTAVRESQWLRATGREAKALEALQKAAQGASGPLANAISIEIAVTYLTQGNRAQAQRTLEAVKPAPDDPTRGAVLMAQFMVQPQAPATEWRARAEKALQGPQAAQARTFALAYALFFARHWSEAAVEFQKLAAQSDPAQAGELEALEAWCWMEAGQVAKAKPLLATWPLPSSTGENSNAALLYPGLLAVRAKAGVGDVPRERELYRKYTGREAQ